MSSPGKRGEVAAAPGSGSCGCAPGCTEPCCAAQTPEGVLETGSAAWQQAARRARRLSWWSLAWLGIEGGVAVVAGLIAGSVALLGFGIDSAIEGLASVIIIWRFSGTRTLSGTSEERAQKAVAVSFFLLAPYIAFESVRALIDGRHAETTWLGIALSAFSLLWMPVLGVMKKRLGAQLGSAATSGEGPLFRTQHRGQQRQQLRTGRDGEQPRQVAEPPPPQTPDQRGRPQRGHHVNELLSADIAEHVPSWTPRGNAVDVEQQVQVQRSVKQQACEGTCQRDAPGARRHKSHWRGLATLRPRPWAGAL